MDNKLVRNEQTKLTATFMNGAAIAVLGVGGLAPLAAIVQSEQIASGVILFVFGCILASMGLHLLARLTLGGLEE